MICHWLIFHQSFLTDFLLLIFCYWFWITVVLLLIFWYWFFVIDFLLLILNYCCSVTDFFVADFLLLIFSPIFYDWFSFNICYWLFLDQYFVTSFFSPVLLLHRWFFVTDFLALMFKLDIRKRLLNKKWKLD